jgi:hypothetical protein
VTNFGLLSLHDQPPSKRPAGWKLFGAVTAAVLALCSGGFLGLGLLVDDPGVSRAAVAASAEARNPVRPALQSTSVTTEITSSPKTGNALKPSPSVIPATSIAPVPVRTVTGAASARSAKPAPNRNVTKPQPKPATTTTAPTVDPTQQGITPGAFCSPEGTYGIGKKNGRLYRCRSVGDDQVRWKRVRS